ncbi:pheromone-regulated protein prm10 [Vanrija albida]|uniref:Pheromone-regulated protein prm10 n=1 Tax=Vanrija albida TaxID=181172 RepID=A0ABR3QEE6_9TREE
MVADDPFHEPPDTRRTAPGTPILRVHSDVRLQDLAQVDLGDPTHGDPVLPPSLPQSGTRTPRRVQWTADHVVNLAPVATHLSERSEQSGVTADSLSSVNIALERFQSHRTAPTGVSGTSLVSMGSSFDGEAGEDYDYRLDPAPMPPSDDDEEVTEEKILDSGVTDQVTSYVPPGETDGLPSAPDAPAAEMQQATNLVRSHTSKWGLLRRRGTKGQQGTIKRRNTQRRDEEDGRRISTDSQTPLHDLGAPPRNNPPINPPLNGPPGGMPAIPGGTSVLSSLLALYNQQQMQSGHSTPGSSRPPSSAGSMDDDFGEHAPHAPAKKSSLPWKRRSRLSHDSSPHSPGFGEHTRSKSETSITDKDYNEPSPGLLGSFQKAVGAWKDTDRPKASRSGAGVFGALVQTSGAIGAAAVPTSATLMPAAKKHGYHLNRYTLAEAPMVESPRSATLPLSPDPQGRPASTYSVSTMVEGSVSETLMPDEHGVPRNKSFDNILTMKRKNKRPTPLHLKSFERLPGLGIRSARTTPDEKGGSGYFEIADEQRQRDEQRRREWEAEKKRRKKEKEKKKKQEIFIIQHVAAVIARQQFILKLARALMMFGSPSHRLETQIQATAKVLEINAQVVYLPNTMLVSFGDDATHTSETKFLKQVTGLDLGKLLATHNVYWDVVHDRVSVEDASRELDSLMTTPPYYNTWQTILIGGLCSVFISIPSFYGSFIDALMCFVLGAFLISVQIVAARNDMLNNVFEITVATLISFVAAVLASTHYFCYTALVSGGVVLILPGYIVLTGALELASRNITAGAVRIGYSVIYSLFLGFGISIGAEVYFKIRRVGVLNADDYTCANTHYPGAPWYMSKPSGYWYYLCVPAYSLLLSLRNQQPIFAKELPVMIGISVAGWVTNHFAALPQAFKGRSDIVSALGSFVVGLLGNLYGRFFSNGASFPVMVTGILFQLPSGLSQGGIFSFVADASKNNSVEQYSTGFGVAQQLISVAIGLTVGLFVAAVVTHPFGGSRRRGAGIFSF